jgi:hypothetical protein
MLGPGWVIVERHSRLIEFRGSNRAWPRLADHGEALVEAEGDRPQVVLRLWRPSARWRRAGRSVFYGAGAGIVLTLMMGWLMHWSTPAAVLIAIGADLLGWRSDRLALRAQVESYLTNLKYLTPS